MGGAASSSANPEQNERRATAVSCSDNILKRHYLSYAGKQALTDIYRVKNVIGRGSFGTVYQCFHRLSGDAYAVKFIQKESLDIKSDNDCEMINKEVEILRACDGHPGILRLIDVFETKTNVQYVMELASGGEVFRRIMAESNFSEKDACSIVMQVTEALKWLHNNGVVHRDLKPENLLLLDKNSYRVKVCDFGLAKVLKRDKAMRVLATLEEQEHAKLMQTACGTRFYAAPEVINHQEYDHSVDFWSLGIIMFVMLSGELPFDTIDAIVKADMKDKLNAPCWQNVSSDAKILMKQMLSIDPSKRPDAEDIMNSAWVKLMSSTDSANTPLPGVCDQLRSFQLKVTDRKEELVNKMLIKEVELCKSLFSKLDKNNIGRVNISQLNDMYANEGILLIITSAEETKGLSSHPSSLNMRKRNSDSRSTHFISKLPPTEAATELHGSASSSDISSIDDRNTSINIAPTSDSQPTIDSATITYEDLLTQLQNYHDSMLARHMSRRAAVSCIAVTNPEQLNNSEYMKKDLILGSFLEKDDEKLGDETPVDVTRDLSTASPATTIPNK